MRRERVFIFWEIQCRKLSICEKGLLTVRLPQNLFRKKDKKVTMKLSHSFSGALRQFSYWIANGTVGLSLLENIDYISVFKEELSLLEQAYAIFANNIEMDENGTVLNAKYAEMRAAQYIRQYCDRSYVVDKPFEGWEVELY